jgi:hypothetical protein
MKSPAELAARLAKQWQIADNREARLLHEDTWPLTLPIGKPTPAQLTRQTDQVRAHLHLWRAITVGRVLFEPMTFRGGAEPAEVPASWQLSSPKEWVAATADPTVQREYATLQRLLHETAPVLHRTLVRQRNLFAEEAEKDVIRAAQIAIHLTPGCAQGRPLRALSVLGSDTKFFERHRRILIPLLDARFDGQVTDLGLEAFLGAPEEGDHWLLIVPLAPNLLPFNQLRVRASELRSVGLPGSHLLLVENEQCLHQLPRLPETIAILGAGLHLEWIAAPAYAQKQIAYWGDMDTWGLSILAKARTLQPRLTALMMDRELFELCRETAVLENSPAATQPPEGLTWVEEEFYRHLLVLDKGRVEQEFIPRECVVVALEQWREFAAET